MTECEVCHNLFEAEHDAQEICEDCAPHTVDMLHSLAQACTQIGRRLLGLDVVDVCDAVDVIRNSQNRSPLWDAFEKAEKQCRDKST